MYDNDLKKDMLKLKKLVDGRINDATKDLRDRVKYLVQTLGTERKRNSATIWQLENQVSMLRNQIKENHKTIRRIEKLKGLEIESE